MSTKNPDHPKHKSKLAGDFRVSSEPVVRPNNEQENVVGEFGDGVGLPRVHDAPMLFAIARDPRTIFTYWSIDWPAVFAEIVPLDRQAHLRVYRGEGVEEKSVAVEPMSGNCSIAVSQSGGSYRVEIGYYQPADVWNSIAKSNEVEMPVESLAEYGDDLATIPLHLSFQRLLDLFGAPKSDALAETISQFQTRALKSEKNEQSSGEEREVLRGMELSLSEIAAARRAFMDHVDTEVLRKRTEKFLGFSPASASRAFSQSSWSGRGG